MVHFSIFFFFFFDRFFPFNADYDQKGSKKGKLRESDRRNQKNGSFTARLNTANAS